MLNNLFSHVTEDIYIRKYEFNPQLVNGLQVFVYAECAPHGEQEIEKEGHYLLDLYFSVGGDPTRDYIFGIPFGSKQMDKQYMDAEIDRWVATLIGDESFLLQINEYMRRAQLWEETLNEELFGDTGDTQ